MVEWISAGMQRVLAMFWISRVELGYTGGGQRSAVHACMPEDEATKTASRLQALTRARPHTPHDADTEPAGASFLDAPRGQDQRQHVKKGKEKREKKGGGRTEIDGVGRVGALQRVNGKGVIEPLAAVEACLLETLARNAQSKATTGYCREHSLASRQLRLLLDPWVL